MAESAHIDAAAHEAATSPRSEERHPTHAQIKAGNYRKATVRLPQYGILVKIENPKGSVRAGIDQKTGKVWLSKMIGAHYGYVRDRYDESRQQWVAAPRGRDKDHLDVFLGPDVESNHVFIVNQVKPDGGFDEHKILLGWSTLDEARAGYAANYSTGWKVDPIASLTVDELKDWLANGDTTKPYPAEREGVLAKALRLPWRRAEQATRTPVTQFWQVSQTPPPNKGDMFDAALRRGEQGQLLKALANILTKALALRCRVITKGV